MLVKTITYTDLYDHEVEITLHFHYSLPELDRARKTLRRFSTEDRERLPEIVKEFIGGAYGVPGEIGLIKDPARTKEFLDSDAYAVLIEELASKPEELMSQLVIMLPRAARKEIIEVMAEDAKNLSPMSSAQPPSFTFRVESGE